MNEAQLRAELERAYSELEAADAAGDTEKAAELESYYSQLEGRYDSLAQTEQIEPASRSAPALSAVNMSSSRPVYGLDRNYDPENPDAAVYEDPVYDFGERSEPEPLDEPALKLIDEAQKASDAPDEVSWGDHWKSMKGSLVKQGADLFDYWATTHRMTQADKLEQLRSLKDGKGMLDDGYDPEWQEKIARLEFEVSAEDKMVVPTFYGIFIKPFFSKDGKEPGQRIREVQDEILSTRSEAAQELAKKPFFNPDPAWHQKLNVGDPRTWNTMFENTAMPWEDMDAFLLQLSQNSTQLATGIVAARVGGKQGAMAKARQLRSQGVVNPAVVRAQAAKAGAATGTVAASASEYIMVRDNTHAGLQEALRAHWGNDELWAQNPRFAELTEAGFSTEYAKQVVADEISTAGAQVAGVASTILGAPMNRFWAKLGLEKAASRAGSAVKGAIGEGLQEGIQESAETLVSNIYESKLDPSKPWTADLANAFFGGAALGSAMGAGAGALTAGDTDVALNKDQKALNKAGFREWREIGNERARMTAKLRDPEYVEKTSPSQRAADFEAMEDLQYKEAKAFKKAEPSIRRMQKKYGSDASQMRRTDKFASQAENTISRIERDRMTRGISEKRVATERQLASERDAMIKQVEADLLTRDDLQDTLDDLQEVSTGGLLETEDQHQRLIDAGYGRWRDKSKTEFVLTKAGRVAQETIPQALEQLEGKLASGYADEERRGDIAKRKALEAMTPEERTKELHTDPVTKGKKRRAFNDIEREERPAPAYAMADVDSLKWFNDKMGGHETGDKLIKTISDAARREGAEFYRTGGDEFVLRADSEEKAEEIMQRIAKRLQGERIYGPEGDSAPPRITWGVGPTLEIADTNAGKQKDIRAARGRRAERDKQPFGYSVGGTQTDLPLMSQGAATSGELDSLAAQIEKLKGQSDEISTQRRIRLIDRLDRMRKQTEKADLAATAQTLMDGLVESPTDRDLMVRFNAMSNEGRNAYELRAAEFYTKLVGEHVSGLEVFQLERGAGKDLWKKIPSKYKDANGNVVDQGQSDLNERVSRIINEGTLPTALKRDLEIEVRRLQELGMESASQVDVLAHRVTQYIGGEMAAGGPTPFSGAVDAYKTAHDMYSESVSPSLMMLVDPVMGSGYYDDLVKNDRVEVIVNGQSVSGTVTSSDPQSVVVRWDPDALKLLDPDTRQVGNTARFSKQFGWQGSARIARGGTSYGRQVNSWPGQARLGRRFNDFTAEWESAPDAVKRRAKINKATGSRTVLKGLKSAARARATKNEMRRARQMAERIFSRYGNLPRISLANSLADLPKHMQQQLVAHGSNGGGVLGMFDDKNPANGVWVVVGNISQKSAAENVPFDTLVAEALVHETIGHYGLRGFMGSDTTMNKWMDVVARSFEKEVNAKGRDRGYNLMVYDAESGKMVWRSIEARRLAAEETIAEMAQRLYTEDSNTYQLSEEQKSIFRAIIDYIKAWMINNGLSRFVRFSDRDIYNMLWNAQNFAMNAKGWEYRVTTGQTLVPYMRDADIFRSAILAEFYEGKRPTNGQERKQMKKDGLEPLMEVPMFDDSLNKGQYIAAFEKLVKDNKVRQAELDFVNIVPTLENLTWNQVMQYSGDDLLPDKLRAEVAELRAIVDYRKLEQEEEAAIIDARRRFSKLPPGIGGYNFEEMRQELYLRTLQYENRERPTTEEVDEARGKLAALLNTPVGKKTKLPKKLVGLMLQEASLQITVYPSGGYDRDRMTEDERRELTTLGGPFITPESWARIRPRSVAYGGYTTAINQNYGAYVFVQANPTNDLSIAHNFDVGIRKGAYAHLRYAEGENADGDPAYYLMELQSDAFQEYEGAAKDRTELSAMEAEAEKIAQRLKGAIKTVVEVIYDRTMAGLDRSYQRFLENPSAMPGYTGERSEDIQLVAQNYWRNLKERANDHYLSLNDALAAVAGDVVVDDARAFDILDKYAARDAALYLAKVFAQLESSFIYDPDGTILDEERTMKAENFVSKVRSQMQENMTVDLAPQYSRLIGKPHLLRNLLNAAVVDEFTDQDIADLLEKSKDLARSIKFTIPAEMVRLVDEGSAESHSPLWYERLFEGQAPAFRAIGLVANGFSADKRTGDGSVVVETFGFKDEARLNDAAALMRIMIQNHVISMTENQWDLDERRRVREAQSKIARMERREGSVSDMDEALEEISFEEVSYYGDRAINAESYADHMTENWIEYHRSQGTISDYTDLDELEYNGETLDRQHSEYRSRLEIDDDGDVDNSDAEDWLSDTRDSELYEYWQSGNDGYDEKYREFKRSFNDQYDDTKQWDFEVPISWDEAGDVTETKTGRVVVNEWADTDEWDQEPIDTSYQIYFNDDFDYAYDEDNMRAMVIEKIFALYNDDEITPPEDSQFFIETSEEVPQSLRDEAKPRERPDFKNVADQIATVDIDMELEASSEKPFDFPKLWEKMIQLRKKINKGVPPVSPMKDVWQIAALRFAIADAIRKGKKSIIWQGGEASSSRGGWGYPNHYFSMYDSIEWKKSVESIGGKNTEVFIVKTPDGERVMLEPSRMGLVIGQDVANEIIRQSADVDPQIAEERRAKRLRDSVRIYHVGEEFLVVDMRDSQILHRSRTSLGAEKARVEEIQRRASMESNLPDSEIQGWNVLDSSQIGGKIAVATMPRMNAGYADTVSAGAPAKLRGARTGYDIVIPSLLNKIAKPYGGGVTSGAMKVDDMERFNKIMDKEAGRLSSPSTFDEQHKNVGVRPLGEDAGFVIVSDAGLVSDRIFRSRSSGENALADLRGEANAGQSGDIKVYELKITDEMIEAFGHGNIPIMAKDPIAGNAVLEAMAKKVGAVPNRLTMSQRFDRWRKDAKAALNQGIFDRFYGIKYAMDRANWQGTAEKDPYVTARLTTSLDSQMRAVMNYGHPVWRDGMMETEGKGLLDILAPVAEPNMLRAWSLFMVARRAARLKIEGREQLITDAEITEGLKLGNTYPIFSRVAQEYADFNRKVLDFAEQAGVIDPDTRPLWEHADYVPFYRVQDERIVGPLGANIGIANQRKPIKQLKGGSAALADIPSNIIMNITNLIDSSNKNMAAVFTVDALKGTGIITKIPSLQAESALVPMSQVKQRLISAGLNPQHIPQAALDGMQKMFVMKPPSGEGVISILRDGKREYYNTTDRLLWDAVTQINRKQFGRWISLFRGPKRFLTAAVTLDPGFMMANYIRDLLSSYTLSRDVPLLRIDKHFARSLQGVKQAMMKDESMRTMMSAGAAFDSGYMNYGDPNSVHRAIRKAQRKRGFRVSVLDSPARIYEFYKEFGASFENANRIAVYNEAIANGKSKKQAAFESKDLMDFSMGGSFGPVQFLIQTVPFFGARLQGLHRMGRGFADDPAAFAIKGLLLTMAGTALYLQYADDERYKELEEWDKDTYYHFWVGNEHYRIPKPFEVGAIFNTLVERAIEFYRSDAHDADKLLLQRFGHMLMETFAFNPMPQVAMPAFENAFNHNFFTGRQIVDPYTEKRMPPEQFRPSTSPTLIELARSLPEGLDKVNKKYRSPLYLENLYRGYTGTLGRYAIMAADEMTRAAMDYPAKPSMQPADYPVLGRFYRGTDDMPRRTKYEETFYDLLRQTQEIQGSMRFLERIGDEGRLDDLATRKEDYVGIATTLEKARQDIGELNADSQQIWMDSDMTADDKRKQIDEIQAEKNEIYKSIYDIRPGAGDPTITPDDLTFLIERFGIDDVATRIEENSPATASLMRDIQNMNMDDMGVLAK